MAMVDTDFEVAGFGFDLCRRNAHLASKGVHPPEAKKTGTTVAGVIFEGGVVLGSDTRATQGETVMQKDCMKFHKIAENIYGAGAGTAADCDFVPAMVSSQLELQRYSSNRQSRVAAAMTMLKHHLFRHQGHLGVALVVGGVDCTGPSLFTIFPHGSIDSLPYATHGSGCLAAMAVFESGYREKMTREEAVKLVSDAIEAGIFNDLGSGSNVNLVVITKDGTEELLHHKTPTQRTYSRKAPYVFPVGQTAVLSTMVETLKIDIKEVPTGEAMQE